MYSSLTSSQYLIGTKGALFINSGQMVLPPSPPPRREILLIERDPAEATAR